MPTVAAVVTMITAVASAAAEFAKLAQTEQGQALIEEGIKNRTLARQWIENAGKWLQEQWDKLKTEGE
jgi:hypothetical protein